MAEYLIQDTTLDAIADAINAKTGGSSAMTPAQMVTAIGTISGGGSNYEIVTVGANNISNVVEAETYLKGLSTLDLSSNKYMIQIESGYSQPTENQIGYIMRYTPDHLAVLETALRYRNSSWTSINVTTSFDAVLVEGTTYKITVLE